MVAMVLAGCGGSPSAPPVADMAEAPDLVVLPDLTPPPDLVAPTCTDGVRNGGESDVDCGGICPRCGDGKSCGAAGDCASSVCAAGKCAAASCGDNTKNGAETDVDCGGGTCKPCSTGKGCDAGSDCGTGVCMNSVCVDASCTDGVKNGSESDLDCGGNCMACANGKMCKGGADCASLVCTAGSCAAPSCMDMVKNGMETDVDCGGGCAGCATGKACAKPADCASLVCTGGACVAATCTDNVKNGNETDIDCGGGCGACPLGKACGKGADCATLVCANNACVHPTSCLDLKMAAPGTPDGQYTINPGGAPLAVWCDMTTDGGGWTVLPLRFADMTLWNFATTGDKCTTTAMVDNNGQLMSYHSSGASGWSYFSMRFLPPLPVKEVRFDALAHATASVCNNMDLTYNIAPAANGGGGNTYESWWFSDANPMVPITYAFTGGCAGVTRYTGVAGSGGLPDYCYMDTVNETTTLSRKYTYPSTASGFHMVAVQGCGSTICNGTQAERFWINHPPVSGVWRTGIKVR